MSTQLYESGVMKNKDYEFVVSLQIQNSLKILLYPTILFISVRSHLLLMQFFGLYMTIFQRQRKGSHLL